MANALNIRGLKQLFISFMTQLIRVPGIVQTLAFYQVVPPLTSSIIIYSYEFINIIVNCDAVLCK